CWTFEFGGQRAITGCQAQAGVESVDLYFVPGLALATLQIVGHFPLKKPAGCFDKLFRSRHACLICKLAQAEERRKHDCMVERLGRTPEKSRLFAHGVIEAKDVPSSRTTWRSLRPFASKRKLAWPVFWIR